ncbi:MAG: FecR family protein [Prolixibacteraceae bacterium]
MSQSIQDIIQKGRSESADPIQRKAFLSLFNQPDHEFELKKYLLEDLSQSPDDIAVKSKIDELFENFWHKRSRENYQVSKNRQFFIQLSKWAAILVVGLFLGYWIHFGKKSSQPVYYTSIAPKGSISEVILPEGTQISLNSGSTLRYSTDESEGLREIFLTGEAWFHVSKMKARPFLVHTPFYNVKVTGTTFNVKAYPEDNEITTTLVEGSVEVGSSENLILKSTISLKENQQLIYNKELNTTSVSEVNTKLFTSWKRNKLVFINMQLKDLKILLERKYGVNIKIIDQSIMDYHYDGTIKNETVLEVLEILKRSLPIEFKIEDQNIIIQKKRRNI